LASRQPSTTHAISHATPSPANASLPATRRITMPIGRAQPSVQATVRHGTKQRPSAPACAAATTTNGSRSSNPNAGEFEPPDRPDTRARPQTATDSDASRPRCPADTANGA
jgi:hypothetical protein